MAIFSKIVIAVTALATLSAARPLNIPRDVTEIVTETDYTTVDYPVTLWVDESGKPLSTVAQGGVFAAQAQQTQPVETTLESSALPSTSIPNSFSPSAAVIPTMTSAPSVQAPPFTSAPPVPVVPTTSQYAAPPPSVPSPPPAAATNNPSSGQSDSGSVSASASGTCEGTGSACLGDITHWDGGLGACGWDVNSASDMQVALPVGFMGTQSNGNPYCGRALTIRNPTTGQTVQATVGDKCMGCSGRSIDLTNALFGAVGGGCDGRCSGFEWWFS